MTEDSCTTVSLLARRALAKKATPGPWTTSEGMDEIWGGLSGSQVKRVLSVKHPVTAPNLAFIEYANPERILRLLSTSLLSTRRGGEQTLRMACYLLALACQRMHCAGCFLTHHKEWCPKSCNEGRAVMEGVSQEEWYSFLREKEGEEERKR